MVDESQGPESYKIAPLERTADLSNPGHPYSNRVNPAPGTGVTDLDALKEVDNKIEARNLTARYNSIRRPDLYPPQNISPPRDFNLTREALKALQKFAQHPKLKNSVEAALYVCLTTAADNIRHADNLQYTGNEGSDSQLTGTELAQIKRQVSRREVLYNNTTRISLTQETLPPDIVEEPVEYLLGIVKEYLSRSSGKAGNIAAAAFAVEVIEKQIKRYLENQKTAQVSITPSSAYTRPTEPSGDAIQVGESVLAPASVNTKQPTTTTTPTLIIAPPSVNMGQRSAELGVPPPARGKGDTVLLETGVPKTGPRGTIFISNGTAGTTSTAPPPLHDQDSARGTQLTEYDLSTKEEMAAVSEGRATTRESQPTLLIKPEDVETYVATYVAKTAPPTASLEATTALPPDTSLESFTLPTFFGDAPTPLSPALNAAASRTPTTTPPPPSGVVVHNGPPPPPARARLDAMTEPVSGYHPTSGAPAVTETQGGTRKAAAARWRPGKR